MRHDFTGPLTMILTSNRKADSPRLKIPYKIPFFTIYRLFQQ
jgi:hypothetical protein